MKENVALVLAIVAVALSGFAVVGGARDGAQVPREGPVLVPVDGAPGPLPCGGDAPVAELSEVMQLRVNPAMTRLSFALFHDRREPAERLDTAAKEASNVVGCLQLASSFHPEVRFDRMSRYYGLLEEAIEDAASVRLAATELDRDAAAHWFLHLKHACARCHAEFRPASEDDR